MTMQMTHTRTHSRRPLRSGVAVLLGFVAVFALSVGTDMVLQAAGVFPPFSEPARLTTPLLLLATAYRSAYTVAGGYIAAQLAPDHPMGHALALGLIGLAAATAGAVVMWNFGPNWYPIALVLTALPCTWLGGVLHRVRQTRLERV